LNELPSSLPGVREIVPHNSSTLLRCEPGKNPQDILHTLVEKGIVLEQFEIAMPTLDEIFIQVVNESKD